MEKDKFKITDEKGVELFLKSSRIVEEKNLDEEMVLKPKHFRFKIFLSILMLMIFIFSIIQFRHFIKSNRISSKEFAIINKQFTKLSKAMNLGVNSAYTTQQKLLLADSLIFNLNTYLYKFPNKKDEYVKMWPLVIIDRYLLNWYDNSYLNVNNEKDVVKLDIVLEQKIKSMSPNLSNVLDLLYLLHEYYYFKSKYPLAPKYSKNPVDEKEIQKLMKTGKKINSIFIKELALLNIKFKPIRTYTKIVLNNYYPQVQEWAFFWKKYNLIKNTTDKQAQNKIRNDLKTKFPNLRNFYKNVAGMSTVKNLVLGIVLNDFKRNFSSPEDLENQLKYFCNYIKKNTGLKIVLKPYSSYSLLKNDFKIGSVDLAVIISDKIYNFAENKDAKPVAFRLYNGSPLINYYLYFNSKNKINDLSLFKLRGKNLNIDGNIYSDIFLETIEFFYAKAINLNRFFKEVNVLPDKVKNTNIFSTKNLFITTQERFLQLSGFKKNISKLLIKQTPSTVFFANTYSLDASIITSISKTLLKNNNSESFRKFKKFAKWGKYDGAFFEKYVKTERFDQLYNKNLLVIDYNGLKNHEVADMFSNTICKYGYNIINKEFFDIFLSAINFPNLNKINFSITKNKNDNLLCKINIYKGSHLLFEHSVILPKNLSQISFSKVVEAIIKQVGFQGEVIEVTNDYVKIYSPLNYLLNSNSKLRFFSYSIKNGIERDKLSIKKKYLGDGVFNVNSGKFAVIKLTQITKNKVTVGDLVDIMP